MVFTIMKPLLILGRGNVIIGGPLEFNPISVLPR